MHSLLLFTTLFVSATLGYDEELAKSPMHRAAVDLAHAQDASWSTNVSYVTLQHPTEPDFEHGYVWKRSLGPTWTTAPKLKVASIKTGVAAMQITVTGSETVLIIDKAENNPLQVKGVKSAGGKVHPAWVQWLNYRTGRSRALDATTNSFCAGGSWLSNGTMVSIGGNPRYNAASYYDANGLTAIRIFKVCNDKTCSIAEDAMRVRLASARWYAGSARLQDGSIGIWGGMTEGGFNNAKETDNPTIEYFPSKGINNGLPVYSKFLHDSLNSNLFPIVHLLTDGTLFVAANERAMIYDWQRNKETRLKNLPGGVRITYPWTAAATLLPLTADNNWTPEMLFCGGSTIDDTKKVYSMSSETPASRQCSRISLSKQGIKAGWQTESLPENRVMGDAILTPDGKVVILNGAKTGLAGYANVHNPIGSSNADNPAFRGVVYDPILPKGKRMSTKMPTSRIARMYHSVATLLPSGEVMIAGSNANQDVTTKTYATEYRIEYLSPPYMAQSRPTFTWCPTHILFAKSFKLIVKLPKGTRSSQMKIVVMDLGYHTHGVSVDQRLVELNWRDYDAKTGQVLVKSPRNGNYFPPGKAWIFVVVNGVPSVGQSTLMGDGSDPPFDKKANENMLTKTARTYGKVIY